MAATDNIIGMVIIVSVLLIGGLLLQTNQLTQTTISFENNQDIYEQQKLSRDVESILQVTEPVSKLPLSRIISNIPYTNNGVGTIYGVDFNQIKYVESVFDSIYGKGNYFVELTPLVSKVRIIFVIDGSSSMYNDLDTITKIIPRILTNFKDRNYNVVDSRAYVLLQGVADNQVKANELTNLNKASDITPDNIIGANNSCTNDSSNKGVYNKYFKNELKNSSSDYFVGYDLYTNALNFRNISPDCNALFNNKIRGQHYEDWATGTLFAAMDIERKSTTDLNDPTMTIIVPVSDEIASGSEADSCYDQTLSPLERSRCELCTADTNRFDRANKLISFAVDKFEEENFDYIIFPIAIKPENTVPDKTDFCNEDGNECTTSSCFDCCDNTYYCEECKRVGDKAGVHNNQTVIDEMLNEMEKLANATGGEVIDLTHGYNDENDFLNNFLNSIEKAESTIKIGEEKNGEKIVITHLLPTSRNTFINAKIGLYNNVDKKEINDVVDIQNIPPVIDFYYSPKIGVIKNEVGFNVTLDARNSFDPEGEELNFEWKKEGNTISTNKKDSIVIDTPGDHNFELLVSDQKGGKSLQKFSIKATVNNTKARLFFVPVNWSSSSEIFYEYVNYQANKFLNQISCRDDIEIVALDPIEEKCNVTPIYDGTISPLFKISTCAQLAGYEPEGKDRNSRVIGLTDDSISTGGGYTTLGYTGRTQLNQLPYSVMVQFNYIFVATHEIGHTFSACDEYSLYDWIRQNNTFSCPNQYPLMCGYDSAQQQENRTNMVNAKPYCATTESEAYSRTYLNCTQLFPDFVKPTTCGNNKCTPELGENGHNCPQDCLILDCPGELIGTNKISIMGSVLAGDFSSRETVYSSSMIETIESVLCN